MTQPILSCLKSLSVSLCSFTHCPTAFHDLLSASLLFFWVTIIGTVVTSLKKWASSLEGQPSLSLIEFSWWQCEVVVVVETILGIYCILVAVLGWHTRGFGGLVVSLDVHLMGYCRECWKFWFDDMKHKAEFLGTSVGWDLESSFIIPICRNIFHFRV